MKGIVKHKGFWVLTVGLLLIAVGLSRGEAFLVLQRGIHICLECIGLG